MNISLIGYMASGKTTMGKLLASALHLRFVDLDEQIETAEKLSIQEIIKNKGELYFRKKEKEILALVLAQDNIVLSTGGGTPCYYDNMEILNKHTTTIYLDVSIKELVKRLKEEPDTRPLVDHLKDDEIQEFVAKHLFERRPFYNKAQKVMRNDSMQIQKIKELL